LHDLVGEYGRRSIPAAETRLNEIYRHFAKMMRKHKAAISDGFNLGEGQNQFKMDPVQMKDDQAQRQERQAR
jgi:hypothetical protein